MACCLNKTDEANVAKIVEQVTGAAISAAAESGVDADYKQEYASNRDAYRAAGMTEEAYISTRRIDDEKDIIPFKTAPTHEPVASKMENSGPWMPGNPMLAKSPQGDEAGSLS